MWPVMVQERSANDDYRSCCCSVWTETPRFLLPSADGWEIKPGVAVLRSIAPEQGIGELRQRHIAVLGALPPVDVDHLPRAVELKTEFFKADYSPYPAHSLFLSFFSPFSFLDKFPPRGY